jgi:hypothetical protein
MSYHLWTFVHFHDDDFGAVLILEGAHVPAAHFLYRTLSLSQAEQNETK